MGARGAIKGLTLIAKLMALKEVADFVQIGLVSWQTAKKFNQTRTIAGRTVGIDGGTVRVQMGDLSFQLPVEDAAAMAGAAGAAGRGGIRGVIDRAEQALRERGPLAELTQIFAPPATAAAQLSRPRAGQDTTIAAPAPEMDRRPFTLREFVIAQQEAAARGGVKKTARELTLEKMREAHAGRLAALDAQIQRERIAGQRDVSRLEIVARLELQRRDLEGQFRLQAEELESKVQLQREKAGFEEVAQGRLFGQQLLLQAREEAFKSTQAQEDRAWRERTQREGSELAEYRKNLNADLALTRSLDAARKIAVLLAEVGKQAAPVVSFASVFGR